MRTKNKLQHIPILITVFLISLLINQIPVQAAADGEELNAVSGTNIASWNGTSGGSAEPSHLDYAGSVDRQGIVFYLVKDDEIVPDSAVIYMTGLGDEKINFVAGDTKEGHLDIGSKLGKIGKEGNWPDENMPKPIEWEDGSWHGNGTKIGEWLLQDAEAQTGYETNYKNWEKLLLKANVSTEVIKELHDYGGKLTLCAEPLAVNRIFYPEMTIEVQPKYYKEYYSVTSTPDDPDTTDVDESSIVRDPAIGCYNTGNQNDGSSTKYTGYLPAELGVSSGKAVVFGTSGKMADYGQRVLSKDASTIDPEDDNIYVVDGSNNHVSGGIDLKDKSETGFIGYTNGNTTTYVNTVKWEEATVTYNDSSKLANYKWVQNALPSSLGLKENQLDLTAVDLGDVGDRALPIGDIVSSNRQGYGISMFNDELKKEQINTYNGSDSPGNTEDVTTHKDGHNYVVKKYIEIIHYTSGGETIDTEIKETATHERNKTSGDNGKDNRVCNNILITDEATVRGNKYKLFGWWLRDSYHSTTGKALYNGNVPGVAIASGTTGTEIDTGSEAYGTQDNKCLYILHVYEHSEKKPTTGSIKITLEESEIMRKVELGDSADVAESTENIFSSAKFKWDYAAYTDRSGLCLTA